MDTADDVQTSWGRELQSWWAYYNRVYAGDALARPVVRLGESTEQLGSWDRRTRTLTIAALHVRDDPWLTVMETLRHEMAHQYADEILRVCDEPPHGPTFRRACEVVRADARSAGSRTAATAPDAPAGGAERASAAITARIHKLLSLGGSPNEHEAQVAVNKARMLLLKHNLVLVGDRGERQFEARWLGPVRGRHHLYEQLLAAILGEFFFVEAIWAHTYDAPNRKRCSVLEVCGTPSNLAMAEYVHGFLTGVAESQWPEYRARAGLTGNRERLRYFAGVMEGFQQKLHEQEGELSRKYALVWKGDPQLDAYLRFRHPSIRTDRAGSTARSRAYEDGVEAGRQVTLRKPIERRGGGIAGHLTG